MLRGGNMRFRPAIFIWFVFAQFFFKFHKNGDIRKLKAWSFWLWKNYFGRLYNEHVRVLQSSSTFFFIHPVQLHNNMNKPWLRNSVLKILQIIFPVREMRINKIYDYVHILNR